MVVLALDEDRLFDFPDFLPGRLQLLRVFAGLRLQGADVFVLFAGDDLERSAPLSRRYASQLQQLIPSAHNQIPHLIAFIIISYTPYSPMAEIPALKARTDRLEQNFDRLA